LVPAPHDAEHEDHAAQAPTQSTGHGLAVAESGQLRDDTAPSAAAQAAPPLAAATLTWNV
jgi:hypothetical protein